MSMQATEERAVEALDEVVYRISHDLRASVRALNDLPGWLVEDLAEQDIELRGEPKAILDLIQSHSRRLDKMLDGLLSYSRVGRLQEIATVHPQDVFTTVLAELAPGPEVRFFTQFNPVEVRIGRADIARIFQILMSNALRHGRSEDHRIEITSCRSGAFWELLVSDGGPGIPDGEKKNVLKPMVKLVSRDDDDGGGMGLAILQKIVDMHGGTLHIEDRKRRGGVTFRVRIPAES